MISERARTRFPATGYCFIDPGACEYIYCIIYALDMSGVFVSFLLFAVLSYILYLF